MSDNGITEWHFDFGLSSTVDNNPVPSSKCDELLTLITKWAESNKLSIGGGYKGVF